MYSLSLFHFPVIWCLTNGVDKLDWFLKISTKVFFLSVEMHFNETDIQL